MEAFSLLKYWRGVGGGAGTVSTTTIATAVSPNTTETDDDGGDNDDGPFFDLEFTVPDEDDEEEEEKPELNNCTNYTESDITENENENEGELIKFTISSGSSGDPTDDPTVSSSSLSPSDDLFFKGRLVSIDPSSSSSIDSKLQFSSLLKSATKFRVLMLKLKKSKTNVTEKTNPNGSPKKPEEPVEKQNRLRVKFKVEQVAIKSLFNRDNSSRASTDHKKQSSDESVSDEKRFSKDTMNKYLNKVKPLYVRASKRYGEKLRFSGQLRPSPPSTAANAAAKEGVETEAVAKGQKQGNLPAGLRVMCKHLGKSKSASSAAVAAAPSTAVQSKRRDDSLLQQQDGIQSAIQHCKRSFNASRGV